jgi:hypothetical protein
MTPIRLKRGKQQLAKVPRYYVMDQGDTMSEAVAKEMTRETPEVVREQSERWLSDAELAVYVDEYARHGFQGGLNIASRRGRALPVDLRFPPARRSRYHVYS